MKSSDWLHMLEVQQEFHRLSRTLLAQGQKQTLTPSERELLALLYVEDRACTPLELSRESGMKKEAVSRSLRRLEEKNLISRERHPADERSFVLSLTEQGRQALNRSYSAILGPIYALRRQMGPEFETLCRLLREANRALDREEQ